MSTSPDRLLYRDDLRFLAGIAGLCALIAIAIIGSLIMKPVRILAGVACALSLSACATGDRQAVLQNLQGCERHYNGVVSGGLVGAGFSGSVKIDCAVASPPPAP